MSHQNRHTLHTELLTLQQVQERKLSFIIPSYQRPYVWQEEDIGKLFDDICNACSHGEEEYFIGTVLSARSAEPHQAETEAPCYELIDGQQRTTTLMLMAIALAESGVAHPIVEIPFIGHREDQPRLRFAIRDQVQELIQQFVFKTQPETPLDSTDPYLSQLNVGLKVLRSRIGQLPENDTAAKAKGSSKGKAKSDSNDKALSPPGRDKLAQYLYEKVCWVNNIVPTGLDLNRLFTTMNTAGVQLEASDILKAKLLEKISSQKAEYEAIWLCCQPMNRYFERNVTRRFKASDATKIHYPALMRYNPDLFRLTSVSGSESPQAEPSDNPAKDKSAKPADKDGFTIAELHKKNSPLQPAGKGQKPRGKAPVNEAEDDAVQCRSIIGFPLLLLHTLRIFLALQPGKPTADEDAAPADIRHRLHSKYLLKNFDNFVKTATEAQVKAFFETLWQVRFHFDDQVIKREILADGKDGELVLSTVSRSESEKSVSFSRESAAVNALSQLQSVRYHTGEQSAQYWLTPFIAQLITAPAESGMRTGSKAFKSSQALLERIDNQLSLTTLTQKEASFAQAQNQPAESLQLATWDRREAYLKEAHGVRFEHYWFYKVEYLLWKQLKAEEPLLSADETKKLAHFYIRSKNSVEHVHPQNEKYRYELELQPLEKEHLDSFGNLALLSPGENSAYSNQPVVTKYQLFSGKAGFDSLKLRALFNAAAADNLELGLSAQAIQQHRDAMLQVLGTHYGADSSALSLGRR